MEVLCYKPGDTTPILIVPTEKTNWDHTLKVRIERVVRALGQNQGVFYAQLGRKTVRLDTDFVPLRAKVAGDVVTVEISKDERLIHEGSDYSGLNRMLELYNEDRRK